MRIFEVNPHNYDSDWDYYDALRARKKEPQEPDDLPEKIPPYTDKDAEDDISMARQKAHSKFLQKRKTSEVDKEGEAPNGQRYNRMYIIDAVDEATAKAEVRGFNEYHWGAKHIVDVRRVKAGNGDNDYPVRYKMYVVDNHKYGMWKPFPGVEGKGGGRPIPDVQDE